MPQPIKPKRNFTAGYVPTAAELEVGELAINWADGKAFTKNAAGEVVTVSLGGSTSNSGGGSFTWASVPASSNAAGSPGDMAYDNGYIYVRGSDFWRRAAMAKFGGDPYFASVALLLSMDGSGSTFTDSSPAARSITANGSVTQSTTNAKWTKSGVFNGSTDYLSLANSGFSLTGNFVIEAWIYLNGLTTYAPIFEGRGFIGFANIICGVYDTGGAYRPDFVLSGTRLTGSSTSVSLNTWTHIAFSRSAGTLSVYVNGTRDSTQVSTSADLSPGGATLTIGRNLDGAHLNGYMDDYRVTIGSDRGYTGSTITVPTAAFLDY